MIKNDKWGRGSNEIAPRISIMWVALAEQIEAALRLAANLPSEDKIATTICQSGRFETGEGVCAAICMDQLGDPRNSGCRHAKIVHKRLAACILERIRSVK